MAEYIEVDQMWKCETCFHNQSLGCTLGIFGCDHGESYRPAYSKLKKADVVPVVRCKDCKHRRDDEDYVSGHYCVKRPSNGGYFCEDCDFCSYGEPKDGDGNG